MFDMSHQTPLEKLEELENDIIPLNLVSVSGYPIWMSNGVISRGNFAVTKFEPFCPLIRSTF